jgi:hypothetical protein
MAEADIPDQFWPAIRLVVNNLVWILPLVAIEQVVTAELRNAAIIGAIFAADLVVAVKWGHLDAIVRKAGRIRGIRLALLGIVSWLALITVGLGAAAWITWTYRGLAVTQQSAPADEGPIRWTGNFSIEGNLDVRLFSLRFLGVNISKTQSLRLKEANIISAVDGTLLPLEISAVNNAGESKIVPIERVQLIPPWARIEMVAKFGDPDPNAPGKILGMEPKAFLEKWRQFSFNATDDVRTYRIDYDDSAMMVFFQGKVGPRVTLKPDGG